MLPPYIIEQIRRREVEDSPPQPQPVVELPIAPRRSPMRESEPPGEQRGVIIIDLG
jgi:hypothetical protein